MNKNIRLISNDNDDNKGNYNNNNVSSNNFVRIR